MEGVEVEVDVEVEVEVEVEEAQLRWDLVLTLYYALPLH